MKYISQLAAMVPPHEDTKQKAPKRIIILGSARCVIPNTIDSQRANTSTALKWLRGHETFLPFASECASTAATTFSSPATTMNLVP